MPAPYVPAIRGPEDNIDVYELGHFEVMQLGLALQFVMNNPHFAKECFPDLSADWCRSFRRVFAQDGKVMIIRGNLGD
jgi:hypothetical protein